MRVCYFLSSSDVSAAKDASARSKCASALWTVVAVSRPTPASTR